MRILFTNDAGCGSQGLHAVADLFKNEHDIVVVAPSDQRSAFSHSISLMPLTVGCKKIDGYGYPVYAIDGTPADCVKFARSRLFEQPDIVVSGINKGGNLGSDVMYSGTVSAAAEAAHLGFRAVALSLNNKDATDSDYKLFAAFFKKNFGILTSAELPCKTFLNINCPEGVPRGVKTVRMNTQETYFDSYDEIDSNMYVLNGRRCYDGLNRDTDEWFCHDGFITVTPLSIDRTDYNTLERISKVRFEL